MRVTIETRARPCPGVNRAVQMAEDALRHGQTVYAVGELIHNSREVARLQKLGLKQLDADRLSNPELRSEFEDARLLIRAHGEPEDIIENARNAGLEVLNGTCQIVGHSQDVIQQHVRDGWRIIIVGKHDHPEVRGLMARAGENGTVVSTVDEAQQQDFEERSLVLAQSTANPDLFHDVCKAISNRLSDLKIMDTTCRFIRTRQKDIQAFAEEQDIVLVVGGKKSSNVCLLYQNALKKNERTYRIEGPDDIQWEWFTNGEKVGLTGGASTPKWQLEEIRSSLENYPIENNPKGLKNKKGGLFSWWMRKNPK